MGDGRSDGIAPVMTTPYLPCQSNHHDKITPEEGDKNAELMCNIVHRATV